MGAASTIVGIDAAIGKPFERFTSFNLLPAPRSL